MLSLAGVIGAAGLFPDARPAETTLSAGPASLAASAHCNNQHRRAGDEGYDHPAFGDIRAVRAPLQNGGPFGKNVGAIYIDVTDLVDRAGHVRGAKVVDVSTLDPRKVSALCLDGAKFVAVITSFNDSNEHSERKLLDAGEEVLRDLGVDRKVPIALKNRTRAVVSERSFCGPASANCKAVVARRARNATGWHLVRHRPGSTANADKLSELYGKSKAAARDRKEALEKKAQAATSEVMTPHTECPTPAGGPAAVPGGSRAALRLVAHCGPPEGSSGLARALTGETGGIDFTTMELSYLADVPEDDGTHAVSYAFAAARGRGEDPARGLRSAKQASDAFFVWLALPASDFWVNLNPNEPHRIIDETFGRTDAGRVLLEADLELKKTVAELTDPRTRTGGKFWNGLAGEEKCTSMRQWIVPGRAVVHATDQELHILRAPLRVKMETQYLDDQGTGSYRSCPRQAPSVDAHNERLYRSMILPRVERRVNRAPEYAALRRVYLSRVAAEWVRERHGYQQTAYDDIVGSGRIGRWASRSRWRPIDTFRAYVRSYRDHEYELTRSWTEGDTTFTVTYVFGGVDFAAVPERKLSDRDFARDHAGLADAVAAADEQVTRDPSGDRLLLGGSTTVAAPGTAAGPSGAGGRNEQGAPWWQMGLVGLLVIALLVARLLVGAIGRGR